MNPAVDGFLLEPPMGSDFKAREFAARGVLVDRERLHAQIPGQFRNRVDIFNVIQGPFSVKKGTQKAFLSFLIPLYVRFSALGLILL